MQTSYGPFRMERAGAVVTVTIDHPPTNLVDGGLIMGLLGLLDALDGEPEVAVVVFRSADPDFFLMHGDVESLLAIPLGEHEPATAPNIAAAAFQRLTAAPYLSVGMIDGAARGGGAEFLVALDLRFGSPRTVIGQPEVAMGILPGAGGTTRLPRIIGRGPALELILTGRDVGAEEARALGWLDALVPVADLEAHTMAVARRVASMPPASIAAAKRVVDASLGDPTDALTLETDLLGSLTASGAHRAPMTAFMAAGGQTREGETKRMAKIVDAMLERRPGT
jgi:enoyl-CoA hydratase/carnithine racemase